MTFVKGGMNRAVIVSAFFVLSFKFSLLLLSILVPEWRFFFSQSSCSHIVSSDHILKLWPSAVLTTPQALL